MRLAVFLVVAACLGCGAEESHQPPRWVDGGATLRPVWMECRWEGSTLEVALVAGLDRSGIGELELEFLVGLQIDEEGTDGELRLFGGWMDTRALSTTFGAHPLDARMASTLAPGTDPTIVRATYATGTAERTDPYAFRGEAEIAADRTSCHGRVDVTKVFFGRDTDRVVFPFEATIEPE